MIVNLYKTMEPLSVFNLIPTGNMSLTLMLKSLMVTKSTMTTMMIMLRLMMMTLMMMEMMIKIPVLMSRMLKQKLITPANLRVYLIHGDVYVSDPE